MMKMNILLVVVVVVVTVESSFLTRAKRDAKKHCNPAPMALRKCEMELQWNQTMKLPINIDINQLCQDLKAFRDCLEVEAQSCKEIRRKQKAHVRTASLLTYVVTNLDYVCSAEGRAIVAGMMTSPCNSPHGPAIRRATAQVKACVTSGTAGHVFRRSSKPDGERCAALIQVMECGKNFLIHTCGSYVGDFVDATWNIFYSSGVAADVYGFQCKPGVDVEEDEEVTDLAERLFE